MTSPNTRHADIQRIVSDAAAEIVANLSREDIPIQVAIAIAASAVGQLIDQLPTEQRAPFLRAYAADLLRTPHRHNA